MPNRYPTEQRERAMPTTLDTVLRGRSRKRSGNSSASVPRRGEAARIDIAARPAPFTGSGWQGLDQSSNEPFPSEPACWIGR